ncbi:collagen alpha-3(V) chain-like [Protopterus annectens]|uniref:collagen alpha-3(V) chain-like n=1 Tax=Protopterus annectens TaxID=7888 RepID=UPI001CF9FB1A|nr:collagen alpha-3(V) chain-like [Protopterus annectens]
MAAATKRNFETSSYEVDLLDRLASQSSVLKNISVMEEEANCSVLYIGQYSTLNIPTRKAFGLRFSDELTVLIKLRYRMQEDTALLTVLNYHSHIQFQIRLSPYSLVFITTGRRHYEFPVSFLSDGGWHRIALGISLDKVELFIDCQLIESIVWKHYYGMGVSTEGLVLIGGIIEAFETPFEVCFCNDKATLRKTICTLDC